MPKSSFEGQVIAPLGGAIRCPCRQTFTYVSDRDLSNKKRLHSRFCSRVSGIPTVNLNPPKKIRELFALGEMDRKISSN